MRTTADELREWVDVYNEHGLAVVRLLPGQKRPTDLGWTESGMAKDDFKGGYNLGVMTGALSGNVVCVDLDSAEALDLADRFLPPTDMLGGRPGKPNSHRYFRVINLAPELT